MHSFPVAFLLCTVAAALSAGADGVAVIAHRGWHQAPGVKGAENSIAGLRAAQNAGFWGSEFDVHMTADEVLVVRHDDKIHNRPDKRDYELQATASLDEPFEAVDDPGDGRELARFYRVEVRLKGE